MKKTVLVLIVLVLCIPAIALSAPPIQEGAIQGNYAFTGRATCLTSLYGFNSNQTPIGGVFTLDSFSEQGVVTFNFAGTAIGQGHFLSVKYSPSGLSSVASGDNDVQLTYSVGPDGTVTMSSPFTGTILTGTATGTTVTESPISLIGWMSKDKTSLKLTSVEPEMATLTFSNGVVLYRICNRTRDFLQLKQGEPDQGQ